MITGMERWLPQRKSTKSNFEWFLSYSRLFISSYFMAFCFFYPFYYWLKVESFFISMFSTYMFISWTGWFYHFILHHPISGDFGRSHQLWHHGPLVNAHLSGVPENYVYFCLTASFAFWTCFLTICPSILHMTLSVIVQLSHLLAQWDMHDYVHENSAGDNSIKYVRDLRIFHLYHHVYSHRNYSTLEIFWDHLFGTFHMNSNKEDSEKQEKKIGESNHKQQIILEQSNSGNKSEEPKEEDSFQNEEEETIQGEKSKENNKEEKEIKKEENEEMVCKYPLDYGYYYLRKGLTHTMSFIIYMEKSLVEFLEFWWNYYLDEKSSLFDYYYTYYIEWNSPNLINFK